LDEDIASWSQFVDEPYGLHGPGAVYDCSKGKDKWSFGNLPGLPSRLLEGQHSSLPQGELDVERLSRLCVVPKDFRGHRLICIEPKELMFLQQGLMRTIYQMVKTNLVTGTCIDFRDQRKSFDLSKSLKYSTIDLSDASDNLRLELCRYLFPKEVYRVLVNARSREVELPDGERVVPTTMFTMGNALCFPIETLVFFTLSLATMLEESGQVWRVGKPRWLSEYVRKNRIQVFGDDIIVPRRFFHPVCDTLAGCGLVVNSNKSCHSTPVREACGSWFFHGIDCTIVRLKVDAVETYSDWISSVETVKLLFQSGFTRTARTILSLLQCYHDIPIDGISDTHSSIKNRRYNVQLQRLEWRLPSLSLGKPDVLTGDVGLYSYFTGKGSHAAPRGDASCIEWGWRDRI